MMKPDPRIDALICERLDVVVTKTVFLDDFEPNVTAARGLGMQALQHPLENAWYGLTAQDRVSW
jgi:HAD superfamily hydrolase (TIGR01509 family)